MQTAPQATRYRPAPTRARVAMACLVGMGLLAVISAAHFLQGFDLADRAARGTVRVGEGEAFDDLTALLARVGLAGLVVTGVSWLVWLHRAVGNAAGLGKQVGFTPAWAVGWWFVPFANIVQPYRIVRSLLKALGARSTATVLWWWSLYLAAGSIANYLTLIPADDLNGFRVYLGTSLLVETLRLASATLAILLVVRIQQLSEENARTTTIVPQVESVPVLSA